MTLDELAQVGLNAELPENVLMPASWFEAGKKAATDAIIAAMLRESAAQDAAAHPLEGQ